MGLFTRLFRGGGKANKEAVQVAFAGLEEWVQGQFSEVVTRKQLSFECASFLGRLREWKEIVEPQVIMYEERSALFLKGVQLEGTVHILGMMKRLLMIPTEEMDVRKMRKFLRVFGTYAEMVLRKVEESEFGNNPRFLQQEGEGEKEDAHVLLEELTRLHMILREFEQVMSESGMQTLELLFEKIELLREVKEQENKLATKFQEKNERLKFAVQKKKEKEQEVEQLKLDPGYEVLRDVYEQRTMLREEQETCQDEVFLYFGKIKPVLQLYAQHQGGNELVERYVADPLQGFLDDSGLAISHVLDHLKTGLMTGKFSFPAEEVNIFMGYGDKLQLSYLHRLQSNLLRVKRDLDVVEGSMRNRYFLFKIQDGEYRVEHFVQQIERLQEESAQMQEELQQQQLHFEREKHVFEQTVKVTLRKEILIMV